MVGSARGSNGSPRCAKRPADPAKAASASVRSRDAEVLAEASSPSKVRKVEKIDCDMAHSVDVIETCSLLRDAQPYCAPAVGGTARLISFFPVPLRTLRW
jgi:hypothetical protein